MAAYQYNPYPVNNRNSNNEQDQVAIFIDWDNLVISNYADRGSNRPDLEVLIRRAQQYGTVVIARAYAEWNVTADRLEVYKAGIEPIYAPVFHADRDLSGQTTRGKSLADPVMVTDCIDFLHLLPQIGTYVLVTGDKDMVPVVRLARLRGRRVVIIGPDYVANVLQQVSDEFIPYRYLLAQVVADPYAAYYQQTGQTPPSQPFYPGQIPPQPAQPAQVQPAQTGTDRRGRRLTGNRRNQSSYTPPVPQPYARITPPPPTAQTAAPQLNPYGYYGQPGQVPPGYPQPDAYAQTGQPSYTYPQTGYQPVPATPAQAQGQGQPTQPVTPPPPAAQVYTAPPTATQPSYQPPAPIQGAPATSTPPTPTVTASASVENATDAANQGQNGKAATSDFNEVKEVIQSILAQRAASGRSQMRARDLKEELLRRIPNFSERRYGFSKFKALLNAAETAGVLQIDQSGHILWVSAPGTPKMQFGVGLPGSEDAAQSTDTDLEEETEGDEEATSPATNPEAQAELAAQPEPGDAVATPDALETFQETAPTVEPQEATYAGPGEEAPETTMPEPATEVIVPEERTTTLVGGLTAQAEPVRTEFNRVESVLGPRPAVLNQPFYQDVIVLIDQLRTRNRWLGYELLLSNVRDLLSREMPESEAKIQAGNILSRLLSDSIIKMAIEVHSRGARKMTVKVAHLQDENPAVRYALESHRLESEAAVAPDVSSVEGRTQLQEAATETGSPVGQPEGQPSDQSDADHGEGGAAWGGAYTQQAHPVEGGAVEAPVADSAGEAGELGQEAVGVAPELVPPDATAEPVDQPQGAELSNQLSGQAVEAPVVPEPGATADTGENVQGEPTNVPQGEEGAPAGGYFNTSEMSAEGWQGETAPEYAPGEFQNQPDGQPEGQPESQSEPSEGGYFAADGDQSPEQSQGQPLGDQSRGESAFDEVPAYGDQLQSEQSQGDQSQGQPENYQAGSPDGYQPAETGQSSTPAEFDQDGKQVSAETLQPVVELDGDEPDEAEESEEAESDGQAPKPARRPRRRRTPRAAVAPEGEGSSGQGESMGQAVERRAPMGHHARPYRRPRSN